MHCQIALHGFTTMLSWPGAMPTWSPHLQGFPRTASRGFGLYLWIGSFCSAPRLRAPLARPTPLQLLISSWPWPNPNLRPLLRSQSLRREILPLLGTSPLRGGATLLLQSVRGPLPPLGSLLLRRAQKDSQKGPVTPNDLPPIYTWMLGRSLLLRAGYPPVSINGRLFLPASGVSRWSDRGSVCHGQLPPPPLCRTRQLVAHVLLRRVQPWTKKFCPWKRRGR